MNKTFLLFDIKTGIHEYTLNINTDENGTHYILNYSSNKEWNSSIRNEVAMSLTDNGNGFLFKKSFLDNLKDNILIDYSGISHLLIINSFINRNIDLMPKYSVIEQANNSFTI